MLLNAYLMTYLPAQLLYQWAVIKGINVTKMTINFSF